ncbi:Fic family protein [Neolewinella agarilytica]|uniref:Fic family protein n=1 Tax=Neolewinella agarilytica TaxID=478744 RepID=A0A1H9BHS0_9BACT|nr:Fic family protein [Neolewinella agarilytica]SEP88277.1 Fic family protein [Neolewinella agarilytica]
MKAWPIEKIPSSTELESKAVLRELVSARAALAELKGVARTIPDQSILINTLGIQEAKDSSAIENIITSLDELFKGDLQLSGNSSSEAKEVQNYVEALKKGFELISEKRLLTGNDIIKIQSVLEKNNAGFRRTPGTSLLNAYTKEVVYTPPQDFETISALMKDLEQLINNPDYRQYDPLVKMAIIHFQFESIHPFYDGNGRTGRIINILYLILSDLLDFPTLYLSNYIIHTKQRYYQLFQEVRLESNWEDWLIYIIRGVSLTAKDTINLIESLQLQITDMQRKLRSNYKFYSHELLMNLFRHPYTKIEFLERDLKISRKTASLYLNKLADDGVLRKERMGKHHYFVNEDLYHLFLTR